VSPAATHPCSFETSASSLVTLHGIIKRGPASEYLVRFQHQLEGRLDAIAGVGAEASPLCQADSSSGAAHMLINIKTRTQCLQCSACHIEMK
jgi:hypothetical protein